MATRRARVKLAPNLGLSRNKNKVVPPTPQVAIKSDTENSESEAASDVDTVTSSSTVAVPNIVETLSKQATISEENAIQSRVETVEITPLTTDKTSVSELQPTKTGDLNGHAIILNGGNEDIPGVTKLEINDVGYNHTNAGSEVVTNGVDVKNKVRVPLSRNKFRPNLNFDRARHGSGGVVSSTNVILTPRHRPPVVSTRTRTVSSSSTNSESEGATNKHLMNGHDSPILRAAITTPKPARIRRTTESSSRSTISERTHYLRRKLDHKKRFSAGVPEHGTLTMFDLIYYNPSHGQRMSVEDDHEETVDDPDNSTEVVINGHVEVEKEETVAKPVEEEPTSSSSIPVPQVKVGANGEIIVDESSLQVETTQAKEAKKNLQTSSIIFEDNKTTSSYGRWSKKRRHNDWSKKETIKFFKALSILGSDFSMMESLFKNRSRQELKLKFKKEERLNGTMVDKCLREKGMFTDLDSLMKETDEDEDDVEDDEYGRARSRKPKKKRPRRRYKNRGYYDSSSDGEEADVEASKSPVRKIPKTSEHNGHVTHNGVIAKKSVVNGVSPSSTQTNVNVDMTGALPLQNGVQFPPGLLAANPSLAGAKPGSLMVVASPHHKPDNASLLNIYMVPDQKKEASQPITAPVLSPVSLTDQSELRLDPAVVRAVNVRQRTVSESKMKRKRIILERDGGGSDCKIRNRLRTCSESGIENNDVEIEELKTSLLTDKKALSNMSSASGS